MKIEKAIEVLKDINTILKTQHMCKVLDDELTKKDVEDYKSRFASVNLAISALEKQQKIKESLEWLKTLNENEKIIVGELIEIMESFIKEEENE